MTLFTAHERAILTCLAEAVVPAGRFLPAGSAATVERAERYLEGLPALARHGARSMVWAIELSAVPLAGRRFSKLDLAKRARVVERMAGSDIAAARHALKGLLAALKASHWDSPEVYASYGYEYHRPAPGAPESPRWLAQVTDGREVQDDQELEVDVVVVGTGAGGAPLAYELAAKGHAVLMLEEGRYFRRHDFNGRAAQMTRMMYRDAGMTVALGNVPTPVWAGCTVGGTTTVNSGTCYRAPEHTFRAWREAHGLGMFSSASMDRYYARVEQIIGVAPAGAPYLGGVAKVIARGCDRLGYVHRPLRRNAPDCDGQGLCAFGCPTGAKRSTDVSYVPMALDRGAGLFASTRVETITVDASGRARGVVARCKGGGKLTVKAQAVVVAAGALMTPVLLQANKLANRSGMVGRNLSIHPAGAVLALFPDEQVEMHRAIPQSYAIEQFAEEGLLFEGSSTPLEITALALPFVGPKLTEVMEAFPHLASFGFMIHDSSRGRVLRAPNGQLVITYSLNAEDTRRMQRGVEVLARVYFAAGATRVFPCVHGFDELRGEADLARLARARLAPADLDVTAYHPLGTACMGTDPATSVVGPDHQAHDVEGLYIVDGSAVPTSLGVNPQLTIMAMATRAAEILDARLSGTASSSRESAAGADATWAASAASP